MDLYELVDYEEMNQMKLEGMIRTQWSPDHELTIYNYTERAQFSRTWNVSTMLSRGLIVEANWPHKIVARPFPKFFNYSEPGGAALAIDEPVVVTDKLDGSLGILYMDRSRTYRIATRGSFTSDQALHASEIMATKYHDFWVDSNWTLLFEIIYPENRIVVDYGKKDDLYLLGAVNIETGEIVRPEAVPGWPGPRTQTFPYTTLLEALQAPVRPGKEGLVVRSLLDGAMVKIKQPEYVELHRIVTGLNEKEIWRRAKKIDLENGPEIDKLRLMLEDIPDELSEWVSDVSMNLINKVREKERVVHTTYANIMDDIDFGNHTSERHTKKVFAEYLRDRLGFSLGKEKSWLKTALFLLFDDKDIRPFLWKLVEPEGDVKK